MAGTYGLMLDAIDDEKAAWYADRGLIEFGRSDDGRVQMYVPLDTMRQALADGGVAFASNDIVEMFGGLMPEAA
jgi:hypothetical protein